MLVVSQKRLTGTGNGRVRIEWSARSVSQFYSRPTLDSPAVVLRYGCMVTAFQRWSALAFKVRGGVEPSAALTELQGSRSWLCGRRLHCVYGPPVSRVLPVWMRHCFATSPV
jgi:hypothetical protein